MSTIAYILVPIIIFYGLIISFLHKASVRFHKMDEKVGNVESAESTLCDSIINDNNFNEKKQNEEEEIKEEQEIYYPS